MTHAVISSRHDRVIFGLLQVYVFGGAKGPLVSPLSSMSRLLRARHNRWPYNMKELVMAVH